MTDRHSVDTITSDVLDQLYADRDRADEVIGELNESNTGLARQAARAEAALTRIRQLAEEHPAGIDTAHIWEALDGTAGPAVGHTYLSTGCHHGDHAYCQAMTGLNGAKRPGSCKHCGAKCQCPCHSETATEGGTHA